MFSYCRNIKEIDLSKAKLPSNITGTNYMFRYCTNLENINFGNMNMTNVTVMNGMFANCPSLSDYTLNNILELCTKATTMGNKELYNLGLTSAQATRCENLSNYQAFLDAGWSTGY